MIKRFLVVALLLFNMIGIAQPVNAHVSSCNLAAYSPKALGGGSRLIQSTGRWWCPDPHHAYQRVEVIVQYKYERRFQPDVWYGIPPSHANTTRHMSGSLTATVYCARGEKTYRTKMIFDMYGDQGNRRHVKYSGEATRNC